MSAIRNFIKANQMAKELDAEGTQWFYFNDGFGEEDFFCSSVTFGVSMVKVYHWGFDCGVLAYMEIQYQKEKEFLERMGECFQNYDFGEKETH